MALNSNPFVEGIDPTATFGGYASVLLQLIRQAQPSSTYGMILFDSTTPDVSGSNAWRKRCVWLDQTDTAAPVLKIYRATGSPGWIDVNEFIIDSTITTAMIQDLAVTIAKLSPAGGTAGQVLRVNAGATAFEFVTPLTLFPASSIPVSRLDVSAFSPGMFRVACGEHGAGGGAWYTVDTVLNNAGTSSLPANAVIPPGAYPGDKNVYLGAAAVDGVASFRELNLSDDIDDNSLSGAKIETNTLPVVKLLPGSEGQVLAVIGGIPTWTSSSPVTPTNFRENFVFATGNWNNAGLSQNVDIALTLPASRTWRDIEIFLYYDKTGGAGSCEVSLKWNTAPETGLVAVSSSGGCGENTRTLTGTSTGQMFRWNGIVPASISATNITFRIEVVNGGGIWAITNSRYELRARAAANV